MRPAAYCRHPGARSDIGAIPRRFAGCPHDETGLLPEPGWHWGICLGSGATNPGPPECLSPAGLASRQYITCGRAFRVELQGAASRGLGVRIVSEKEESDAE